MDVSYRDDFIYRDTFNYRGTNASRGITGGQWYDIRYEQAWVKDHNDEWLPRVVPMEDWMEFYLLAENDF